MPKLKIRRLKSKGDFHCYLGLYVPASDWSSISKFFHIYLGFWYLTVLWGYLYD